MKKKITLVTGTENTRINLKCQLESYIGEFVEIESYATDEGIKEEISSDLVIISSPLIYDDAINHINGSCPIIRARRVLNYGEIERILLIKSGENVLFVNDVKETTMECIDWLKRLGIDHINYIPYYPGVDHIDNLTKIKIAITPGEIDLIPPHINEIIDMGTRLIDMTTIGEILKELDLFEEKWEYIPEKYMAKLIDLAKELTVMTKEKTEAYHHIKMVMDGVKDGILAFNDRGSITVFNENLICLLGVKKSNITGKNIKEIIVDKSILNFLINSEEASSIFKIKDMELMLTRFKIVKEGTTVVTFKDTKDKLELEKQIKKELYNKGYYAKYFFVDIVGTSQEINHIKGIAKKLAVTDLTVLIEGESGTGKELFASAIHNESLRKSNPFIAVNFSSISENLVESELFGYEEGSFTGAVKGGKPGLFEQSNGGTIFLDEIGDISMKVQSRLLRVLQEKEIMRVGGNKIIPIDVRIVAATNQNLAALVDNGIFRSDLYHRLKVLYVKVPPLRKRNEDILPLIRYFMTQKGCEDIEIDEEVIERLENYPWLGNVRELKNTIDYMLAVCNNSHIVIEDLPQESFFQESHGEKSQILVDNIEVRGDYVFILKSLYEQMSREGKCSRQKLAQFAKEKGINLSEQMIRTRLNELEIQGYVSKSKGKSGTVLTTLGITRVKKLLNNL